VGLSRPGVERNRIILNRHPWVLQALSFICVTRCYKTY
jgi:hypothetical protein